MPRVCSICIREDRVEIDKALINGDSNRLIAKHFGVTFAAVQRHKVAHLSQILADAVVSNQPTGESIESTHPSAVVRHAIQRQEAREARAVDVFGELLTQLDRLGKLYESLDRWLSDPENPDLYSIDPRADEIRVIYEDWNDINERGKPRRKRARLSHLLRWVAEESAGAVNPVSGETKYKDPRELIVAVSAELRQQMALRAQLLERLHGMEEEEAFRQIVLAVIDEEAPDVRARIDHRLGQIRPPR